jgi:hypothetical protein
MGIFGWSYPPGCSSLPWDEDHPCCVCGEFENKCICPECPECSSIGDPVCYEKHGLERTEEQIMSLAYNEACWEDDARNEVKYLDESIIED